MTKTELLIDRLAKEGAKPVQSRPGAFIWPMLCSAVLSLAALAMVLGQPLAALPVIGIAPYAMKLAFALSVGLMGVYALHAAGRPGCPLGLRLGALAVPFLALAVLATLEVASVRPDWPGRTWLRCIAAIGLLAPFAFTGMLVAMRRLAPTRPRVTGGIMGVAAGGIAASAYGFWCPESTAVFLFSWYAVPILVLGTAGALLGPRLLHW